MSEANAAVTEHALETYTPEPRGRRRGVALALSGGGFRAALYHLGALRRLNELGVLSRLDTISSVSGGSIASAFLAARLQPWPEPGRIAEDFETQVAAPLERFTATNIRTWPVAKRLLPWNWLRSETAVRTLAATYEREIGGMTLGQLPERPDFVYCATDLSYAVNWVFERRRMGDYQAGYVQPPPQDWRLAAAVAASSCFPPVFNPLRPGLNPEQVKGGKGSGHNHAEIVRSLSLSDGGVYDNMGLEPVWKNHDVLLVSDGGSTFDAGPDRGFFWQMQQYTAVMGNQASAIRKRWLIAAYIRGDFGGAYWGIGSAAAHYDVEGGYTEALVDEVISEVRTDLDAFSPAEQAVLQNHGYIMAEAAVRRHAPDLISPEARDFRLPYPDWLEESRVRQALRQSHKRRLLGRR